MVNEIETLKNNKLIDDYMIKTDAVINKLRVEKNDWKTKAETWEQAFKLSAREAYERYQKKITGIENDL